MHPTNDCLHIRSRPGEPTWELALIFPVQGQWTETEYLALDGNHLIELSDGVLEVLPMLDVRHQLIVGHLLSATDDFTRAHRAGQVLMAPLPLRLWPGTYREPDILLFQREHGPDVHGYPTGADLVMEVVGEGVACRRRDYETKRADYAKARIKEYWIVDPAEHHITILTLDGSSYREHGVFGPGDRAGSALLQGFALSVDAVFTERRV